jgi:hypothetical protein
VTLGYRTTGARGAEPAGQASAVPLRLPASLAFRPVRTVAPPTASSGNGGTVTTELPSAFAIRYRVLWGRRADVTLHFGAQSARRSPHYRRWRALPRKNLDYLLTGQPALLYLTLATRAAAGGFHNCDFAIRTLFSSR